MGYKYYSALKFLQDKTEIIRSFFHLPETEYTAIPESALWQNARIFFEKL